MERDKGIDEYLDRGNWGRCMWSVREAIFSRVAIEWASVEVLRNSFEGRMSAFPSVRDLRERL